MGRGRAGGGERKAGFHFRVSTSRDGRIRIPQNTSCLGTRGCALRTRISEVCRSKCDARREFPANWFRPRRAEQSWRTPLRARRGTKDNTFRDMTHGAILNGHGFSLLILIGLADHPETPTTAPSREADSIRCDEQSGECRYQPAPTRNSCPWRDPACGNSCRGWPGSTASRTPLS